MIRDNSGTVAIEAAIVFPVFILLLLGTIQVAAIEIQYSATMFTAQSAAAVASRAAVKGTDPQAAALSVLTADAGLFRFGSVPTLQSVTVGDDLVTATVSATMPPLFPLFPSSITATVSATD